MSVTRKTGAESEAMIEAVRRRPIGAPDAADPGKLSYVGYVSGGVKPVLKVVVAADDRDLIISVMWKDGV